tara:strand:- start:436 stop:726 length:291 start_codon:yes stop_codon:yes gene_type:complete
MSGGSLDYLCYKVGEVADQLTDKNNTTLQRAFGEHLKKVEKALHDVEWVFSGDYGTGDDEKAIKEVLQDSTDQKVLAILKSDAVKLIDELSKFTHK